MEPGREGLVAIDVTWSGIGLDSWRVYYHGLQQDRIGLCAGFWKVACTIGLPHHLTFLSPYKTNVAVLTFSLHDREFPELLSKINYVFNKI